MSGFSFRPATRENVGLLIGLAGSSGSGKTYTAMRLASGISGGKPFAVIDTEAGRAKHYADAFRFDHGDLKPPFRPDAYAQAIAAADAAGYPVIVVDSMSHEWAGEGGILDWQVDEYERLGGRDSVKLLSWAKPKQSHKHMVQKLLQVRAHLILCFRAEEKIDMIKEDGKTKIVPKEGPGGFKGWLPICEKNLPYELTASFLLMAERPGVPLPMKLQEQHRPLFPLDRPITEESGKRIAEWAIGGMKPKESAPQEPTDDGEVQSPASDAPPAAADPDPFADPSTDEPYISADQAIDLEAMCSEYGVTVAALKKAAKVERLSQILAADFERALTWIRKHKEAA
jgi:hypothetical protein